MDTSHADAGCLDADAGFDPALVLAGRTSAIASNPVGMTACIAAPLIQKLIA